MRSQKEQIKDEVLEARCIARVDKMRSIVHKYNRTLSPHDFCLSKEDVCQIPDIRKVIIDGIDEDFLACTDEVTPELPRLTSKIHQERTAKISLYFRSTIDPTLSSRSR